MQYSIINLSKVKANDLNLSSDYYLINRDYDKSRDSILDHFDLISDTVLKIKEDIIEYGLTNSITHFLENGEIKKQNSNEQKNRLF